MGIEMYNNRKYIVLALKFLKIWEISTFTEVLIY